MPFEEVDAPPGIRHEKLDRVWLGLDDQWRREYATFTRIRVLQWDYCVFYYTCRAISAPPNP